MKKTLTPIEKFKEGDSIQGFYLCVQKNIRHTRNGDLYLDLELRDITGHISERDRQVADRTGCKILWKGSALFLTKVESIMSSVYVQKLIENNLSLVANRDEPTHFPLKTLNYFNRHLTPERLEEVCDNLVEIAFLEGVQKVEEDKYYCLRDHSK